MGVDSVSFSHWLLKFGGSSTLLRRTITDMVEWLANKFPPWGRLQSPCTVQTGRCEWMSRSPTYRHRAHASKNFVQSFTHCSVQRSCMRLWHRSETWRSTCGHGRWHALHENHVGKKIQRRGWLGLSLQMHATHLMRGTGKWCCT